MEVHNYLNIKLMAKVRSDEALIDLHNELVRNKFNTQININYSVVEGVKEDISVTFILRGYEALLSIKQSFKKLNANYLSTTYNLLKNLLHSIKYEYIDNIEISVGSALYPVTKKFIENLNNELINYGFTKVSTESVDVGGCKILTHTYTSVLSSLSIVKAVVTIEELVSGNVLGIVLSKKLRNLSEISRSINELLGVLSSVMSSYI